MNPGSRLGRLVFLDGFRGFVVASMVLVNNPGDPRYVYSQLAHVPWHGMVFADVIAAWFLWTIGITTSISMSRRLNSASRRAVLGHVATRAALLYASGVALMALPAVLAGPDHLRLDALKLMGILQRIAICYFLAAGLYLVAGARVRMLTALALLMGYWAALTWLPGRAGVADPFSVENNLAFALDRLLLGQFGDTFSHALFTIPAATSTVLFGTLVGDLLISPAAKTQKLLLTFGGGIVLCAAALLCITWIPVNRYLWTPSYVLLTTGLAMATLAACWSLFALRGFCRVGGWLVAYGVNPLTLFVLSEIGRILAQAKGITDATGAWHSLWVIGFESLLTVADPYAASMLFAIAYTSSIGALAVVMLRRGWIVKF